MAAHRVKTTPNSPRRSVQVVESVHSADAVRQCIVRHMGIALSASLMEIDLHYQMLRAAFQSVW